MLLKVCSEWQHRIIAQACDSRTAIGLARLPEVPSSFFLPPPFKDLKNEHLKLHLLQLLLSLPTLDVDICLQFFSERAKSLADHFLKKQEEWNSELEDSFNIYHSERKKKAALAFEKLSLQALLVHSSIASHRLIMLEKGILKLLLSVCKYHENDPEFQSLIGQILANFALEAEYEVALHNTGWVGILASWSKSPYIQVSLPAAKALANLDRDDFHHSYYDNGIYLLHPHVRQRKQELCADIIFVHGLLGATFWTWRQHDSIKKYYIAHETDPGDTSNLIKSAELSENNRSQSYTFCWPKDWLASDFPNARLISIDYNTCISKWGAQCPQEDKKDTLDAKASNLIDKLLISNIGKKPIIWITHSMGGLLVKQILLLCEKSKQSNIKSIAQNTKGVIFFSVPHKGSDLANIFQSASYIFQPSIDMRQLYKGSPMLLSLHESFKDLVHKNGISVLSFGETKKSRWGLTLTLLVSEDSSDPGFGEFYALPADHLSTCKPESPETKLYSKIVEFIHLNIQEPLLLPKRFSKLDFEVLNMLSLIP